MFLATRPSRRTIERFLEESQALPFWSKPIGAARHKPDGYNVDETIVAIGHGQEDFDRAKAALAAWRQFDIGWVRHFPRPRAEPVPWSPSSFVISDSGR